MSCPVCDNTTSSNKTFCTPECAKLFRDSVRESYVESVKKNPFEKGPFFKGPFQKNDTVLNKPSYQDLLKQNQEKVAGLTVTNKCNNDTCHNQTTGNYLYCYPCSKDFNDNKEESVDDGKCKKCKVNDRNGTHPICNECFQKRSSEPKVVKPKSTKYDKKLKKAHIEV